MARVSSEHEEQAPLGLPLKAGAFFLAQKIGFFFWEKAAGGISPFP